MSARPITRLGGEYGGQWITLKHAAEILEHPRRYIYLSELPGLPYRVASVPPGCAGRRPKLVRLQDIERIKRIKDQVGVDTVRAARFVSAEIEGRI